MKGATQLRLRKRILTLRFRNHGPGGRIGEKGGQKMNAAIYLFTGLVMLSIAAVAFGAAVAIRAYLRYRGKMLFTCPETGKAVVVKVAAGEAARSSLIGRQSLKLANCSRWPERQDCGQECVGQLGADPENCLVWTKVADWYRGRECAYCHKTFGELHWHDRRPALIGPDLKTVQWSEVSPEKLPEIFETHLPVCWSCHIAQTFRREHPERVVDRPGNRGPMGELLDSHRKEERVGNPMARV